MDPELFLKDLRQQWDHPRRWLVVPNMEQLERLRGQRDVLDWVLNYFAEKRKD